MNSHQRRKQRRKLRNQRVVIPFKLNLSIDTTKIGRSLADTQKKLAEYVKSPEYQLQMQAIKMSFQNLHTHFVGVNFKPFVDYAISKQRKINTGRRS